MKDIAASIIILLLIICKSEVVYKKSNSHKSFESILVMLNPGTSAS